MAADSLRASSPSRAFIPALVAGVGLLYALDIAGAVVAVRSGLNPTLLDALGPTARLSAPIPMMIAQAILVLAAGGARAIAIPASLLLGIACVLAFVSGFFDGAYAAHLTQLQRVMQVSLVTAHLAVGVVAGLRAAALMRR